jgi:hypothetical protein
MSATPARDELAAFVDAPIHHTAESAYGWECGWGAAISHVLTNRSLVLAALVEQSPLTDDELRVLIEHVVREELLRALGCVGTAYPTPQAPSRFISKLFPNRDLATGGYPEEAST